MIPIHFGLGHSPLYGVLHPASEARRRHGILILGPWGWEAIRAHRTLRELADRLSEVGFDTFRFDYSGSGDSMGSRSEVSATAWIRDAEMAMDELMAVAGVTQVSLLGLRLGGLFAAELSSRHSGRVCQVVLWEPALSHADFLRWIERTPVREANAFPVPPRFRQELEDMGTSHLDHFAGDLLAISTNPISRDFPRARSVAQINPESTLSPCWKEDRDHGAGAVPVDLLIQIQRWFDAR